MNVLRKVSVPAQEPYLHQFQGRTLLGATKGMSLPSRPLFQEEQGPARLNHPGARVCLLDGNILY